MKTSKIVIGIFSILTFAYMLSLLLLLGAATIVRFSNSISRPYLGLMICFLAAGIISIVGNSSEIASGITALIYVAALILGLFIGDGTGVLLPLSLIAAGLAVIYLVMAVYQLTRLEKA